MTSLPCDGVRNEPDIECPYDRRYLRLGNQVDHGYVGQGLQIPEIFGRRDISHRTCEHDGPLGLFLAERDQKRKIQLIIDPSDISQDRPLDTVDELGIDVDEVALRRPTLDDAFLALTGHVAAEPDPEHEYAEEAA